MIRTPRTSLCYAPSIAQPCSQDECITTILVGTALISPGHRISSFKNVLLSKERSRGTYVTETRRARIKRLLLATRSLDRRVDKLTARLACRQSIGHTSPGFKSRLWNGNSHDHNDTCMLDDSAVAISTSLTFDRGPGIILRWGLSPTTSRDGNIEMMENPACLVTGLKLRNICQARSHRVRPQTKAKLAVNYFSDSLSLIERMSKFDKKVTNNTSNTDYPPELPTFSRQSLMDFDHAPQKPCCRHFKLSKERSVHRYMSTAAATERAETVLPAFSPPSDLHLQFLNGYQWLEALALSDLQLAGFRRRCDTVAEQQKMLAALHSSTEEARQQRVKLLKQRVLYEALLYDKILLHGVAFIQGMPLPQISQQFTLKSIEPSRNFDKILKVASEANTEIVSEDAKKVHEKMTPNPCAPSIAGLTSTKTTLPLITTQPIQNEPLGGHGLSPDIVYVAHNVPSDASSHDRTLLFSANVLLADQRAEVSSSTHSKSTDFISMDRDTPGLVECERDMSIGASGITTLRPAKTNSERLTATGRVSHVVGDRVEAQFGRGRAWFLGHVVGVCGGGSAYDIMYDDGDIDVALPARFVRDPLVIALLHSASIDDSPVAEQLSTPQNNMSGMKVDVLGRDFARRGNGCLLPDSSGTTQRSNEWIQDDIARSRSIAVVACPNREKRRSEDFRKNSFPACCPDESTEFLDLNSADHLAPRASLEKGGSLDGKEQNQTAAAIDAKDRRAALESMRGGLQREVQACEGIVQPAKEQPKSPAPKKDAPGRAAFLAGCLNSLGYDHIECLDLVPSWLRKGKINNNEKFDSHSFTSAMPALRPVEDHADSFDLNRSISDKISIYADSFASRTNELAGVIRAPTDVVAAKKCTMREKVLPAAFFFEYFRRKTIHVDLHYHRAVYNRIEAAELPKFGFGRLELWQYADASTSFFAAHSHLNFSRSLVSYDFIQDVELCIESVVQRRDEPDRVIDRGTMAISNIPLLGEQGGINSPTSCYDPSLLRGYDVEEVAFMPGGITQPPGAFHICQPSIPPEYSPGPDPQIPVSPQIPFEAEISQRRGVRSSLSIMKSSLDPVDPDASTPLARHDFSSSILHTVRANDFNEEANVARVLPQAEHRLSVLLPFDYDAQTLHDEATPTPDNETPGNSLVLSRLLETVVDRLVDHTLRQSITATRHCSVFQPKALDVNTHPILSACNLQEPSKDGVCVQRSTAEASSFAPEQAPRDWSQAVAVYALWLTSSLESSGGLTHNLCNVTSCTSERLATALLELFIDTEQRCDAQSLDFSVNHLAGDLPLTGGSREQAQIHRHAIFDALAEAATKRFYDARGSITALFRWFKQPGEEFCQIRPATLIASVSPVTPSKPILEILGPGQIEGYERGICLSFADRLLNEHLRIAMAVLADALGGV